VPASRSDQPTATAAPRAELVYDEIDAAAAEVLDEQRLSEAETPPRSAAGRPTASVRAVTEVEVLVLRAKEVQWVLRMVRNDLSIQQELMTAIAQRQRELAEARKLNAAERAA
jgi:hypothetical protein